MLKFAVMTLVVGWSLGQEAKSGGATSYSQVTLGGRQRGGGEAGIRGDYRGAKEGSYLLEKKVAVPVPVQVPKPFPVPVPVAFEKAVPYPVRVVEPLLYPLYKEPLYLAKVPPLFQPYPNTYPPEGFYPDHHQQYAATFHSPQFHHPH